MNGSLCLTAAIAGSVMSSAALAQATRHAPTPAPALTAMGSRLVPLRVAPARRINGAFRITGPWQPYRPGATDLATTPLFDCFEADPTGAPIGFCDSCNSFNAAQCPPAGPGSRYSYPTSNTAWSVNDMTVGPGLGGTTSTRVEFAWGWGPVSGQCFVGIFTDETMNPCGSVLPADGAYDGVVFDFGTVAGGTGAPYHYADADLSQGTLFFQMPMDGSGAYEMVLANAFDPVTGALTLDTTPGTRPMLWGCGGDEQPAENRVGTQVDQQWDDAGPLAPAGTFANGTMESATECLAYNFGPGAFCPFRLGSMILFYGEGAPPTTCYPNCDHSTTIPFLNVLDFNCFLNAFSTGQTYANCDLSTTPPVLNVLDFNCFLNAFSTGCSAP